MQDNKIILCSSEPSPSTFIGEQVALQPRLNVDPQSIFTFFGKGYYNPKTAKWVPSTKPKQTVDIVWVWEYIKSERAKWPTDELRRIMPTATDQELRDFKLREFEAVAAAGTFSYGSANGLITRSRYATVDFDDLQSIDEAREVQHLLIADKHVETALCFVSPKGHGVKWLVELPEWCKGMTFSEQYSSLSQYVGFQYGLQADPTGSNVNRLCFLPHDPECFINHKYLTYNE